MGTRGTITIIYQGKIIKIYNHCDSYPDRLGEELVKQIKYILRVFGLDWFKSKVLNVRIVDETTPPTEEEIEKLKPYTSLFVSSQSTSDWYCILRKTQGDIKAMLECGYALPYDGDETCNYVIDLDNNLFYYKESSQTFPLDNIPEDWVRLSMRGDEESDEDNPEDECEEIF